MDAEILYLRTGVLALAFALGMSGCRESTAARLLGPDSHSPPGSPLIAHLALSSPDAEVGHRLSVAVRLWASDEVALRGLGVLQAVLQFDPARLTPCRRG